MSISIWYWSECDLTNIFTDGLKKYFETFGEVTDSVIMIDPVTEQPRSIKQGISCFIIWYLILIRPCVCLLFTGALGL